MSRCGMCLMIVADCSLINNVQTTEADYAWDACVSSNGRGSFCEGNGECGTDESLQNCDYANVGYIHNDWCAAHALNGA